MKYFSKLNEFVKKFGARETYVIVRELRLCIDSVCKITSHIRRYIRELHVSSFESENEALENRHYSYFHLLGSRTNGYNNGTNMRAD